MLKIHFSFSLYFFHVSPSSLLPPLSQLFPILLYRPLNPIPFSTPLLFSRPLQGLLVDRSVVFFEGGGSGWHDFRGEATALCKQVRGHLLPAESEGRGVGGPHIRSGSGVGRPWLDFLPALKVPPGEEHLNTGFVCWHTQRPLLNGSISQHCPGNQPPPPPTPPHQQSFPVNGQFSLHCGNEARV